MTRVRRRRGERLPDGSVYVGRPSRWGNPFKVGEFFKDSPEPMDRREAVARYRHMWAGFSEAYRRTELEPLRGKNLACWCPLDEPCHADFLLELLAA